MTSGAPIFLPKEIQNVGPQLQQFLNLAVVPVAAVHLLEQKCTKKDMLVFQRMTGQDVQFPPRGVGECSHSVSLSQCTRGEVGARHSRPRRARQGPVKMPLHLNHSSKQKQAGLLGMSPSSSRPSRDVGQTGTLQ